MHVDLGSVELKTGERVDCHMIEGPDAQWSERINALLGHKGDVWSWHIKLACEQSLPIVTRFYVLHRGGKPFANMMTVTHNGVGLFGHVFTHPDDRRKSAATVLMERQMAHFRDSGGEALILGTGYDTAPFHIYRKFGFEGVEPQSGCMAYFRQGREAFENRYFAAGATTVQPHDWKHWPAAAPLFNGGWPGTVRFVGLRVFGRGNSEYGLLRIQSDAVARSAAGKPTRAVALVSNATDAVVGLAMWEPDRTWPGVAVVDVWCHPNFWAEAGRLLQALPQPDPGINRVIAYADPLCPQRREALLAAGFQQTATLPRFLSRDVAGTGRLDVELLMKT